MSYLYYNPNPNSYKEKGWKHNDCVVRAICAATGFSWSDIYKILVAIGKNNYVMPNDNLAITIALEKLGFFKVKRCSKKDNFTVKDIASKSKKDHRRYICSTGRHMVCCREGYIMDTWDSSNELVKEYWIK